MAPARSGEHAGPMTTTPPEAPPGQPHDDGPRVSPDEMRDLGRLRRSSSDRKVAGVAGGLARHLDIDPLVLRVLFVVLAFFGGAGLILYGACWLLVPDEESGRAAVTLDDRSRTAALVVAGALAALALVGDSWGIFWFPWPLAIIAVVVLLLVTRSPGGRPASAAEAPPGGAAAAPAPAFYRPPDPRRRGPVLFWFTLALVALGVGILGVVDVAGAAVPAPAYPALVVGLIGTMLVVGSAYGRAGGLIALGLVASLGLAGVTAGSHWDGEHISRQPATAGDVESRYDFGAGELVLDLTSVSDPDSLDGRTVHLEGGMGRIEVLVPDDWDVEASGRVGGPGAVDLFGESADGIATELHRSQDGGTEAPVVTIDAQLGVGEIVVSTK